MHIFKALAVVAALFATAAMGQDKPAPTFSETFVDRNPRTLAVLRAEFPDEHRALLERIGIIERGGQSEMLMLSNGFDAVGAIRRKYAARLEFAPPQALTALLASTAGFYEAVFKGEGPGGCGVFAQNGTGALFQLSRSEAYAKEIDLQSAMFLEAVAAAIERPEYYGAGGQEDFAALLVVMTEAGVPPDYLAAIAGGKPSDPNLCPALATMFKAAAVFDTPEGLRVRADLAKNLAGY
jgi:hypothetical protein